MSPGEKGRPAKSRASSFSVFSQRRRIIRFRSGALPYFSRMYPMRSLRGTILSWRTRLSA